MNITSTLKIALVLILFAGLLSVPLNMLLNRADAASIEGAQSDTGELSDAQSSQPSQQSDTREVQPIAFSLQSIVRQDEIAPTPSSTQSNQNSSLLNPTEYTSENYVAPKYDPFDNKYRSYEEFKEKIEPGDRAANTAPKAKFTVRTKQNGLADTSAGTTQTDFIFDAYAATDEETRDSRLQVRWDFESDGEADSYFSRTKRISHKFEQPGTYKVTLEVLDGGGLTDTSYMYITAVENTPPKAHFYYSPVSGTTAKTFTFTTSKSTDSQYRDYYLEYRFDWDGDGIWDTPYKQKTVWNHQFDEPGSHTVIMEAKDPEGATDTTMTVIEVFQNTLPTANFTVEKKVLKVSGGYNDIPAEYKMQYNFDATSSTDVENPSKLKYRWDFNYTGKDDIQYDTLWSASPKKSGTFDFPGEKTIRLQVMDEDGATAVSYAKIVVE